MKAEFIKDIHEGLFFTKKANLGKMDLEQAASYALLISCTLNILRYEKETMHFAQDYARKTLSYVDFKGFRSSATDLYNLLAILQDPNQINLEKLKPHKSNEILAGRMHLPVLQTKAYLHRMAANKIQTEQDRQYFFKLDSGLAISNPDYSAIRRLASDWPRLLPRERKLVVTRLLLALRHMGTSDVLKQLEIVSKIKNYELNDVCNPETGKNCDTKPTASSKPGSILGTIGKGLAIGAAAALGGAALGYALTRDKK